MPPPSSRSIGSGESFAKADLLPLLEEPREDLSQEYKNWIDLAEKEKQAILAKAAIALANHGGGFIVVGFKDDGTELKSVPRPATFQAWSQDEANAAIGRYADPKFQVGVYTLQHPQTGHEHLIVAVPGASTAPIMSTRDCEGAIVKHRCYIRKPGPISEEPKTGSEWRALIDRCVRSSREDMLDAIRAIVVGVPLSAPTTDQETQRFSDFIEGARSRWRELVDPLPPDAKPRLPLGHYEIAIAFPEIEPAKSLNELRDRLAHASRVKLTGWPTFLEMPTRDWAPYVQDDFIEAWVGKPIREDGLTREPARCDFWRADRFGYLYTIRGYTEDGTTRFEPGTCIDVALPVWRIGETLLFALRLSEVLPNADQVLVKCHFTSLKGRVLESLSGLRAEFGEGRSQSDEVKLSATTTVGQLRDNLVEVLHALLAPLYERFDFMQLPISLVQEELQALQARRY